MQDYQSDKKSIKTNNFGGLIGYMNSEDFVKEVLYDEETLQKKAKELGEIITRDYDGKKIIVVCILKGAVMFATDLIKQLNLPLEIEFMIVSSYGSSTKSSGVVKIIKDLDQDIAGKDILIVEDIIDTGLTLSYLRDNIFSQRNPNSVKICTLLDKPSGRKVDLPIDYIGFTVPNAFLAGYGLDYAEEYRNIPYIFIMKEEIYQK